MSDDTSKVPIFPVMGKKLEVLWLVTENKTNTVYVCTDKLNSEMYSMILIKDSRTKRYVSELTAGSETLSNISEYKGSFAYKDNLCLLFNYKNGGNIENKQKTYGSDYQKRTELSKKIVELTVGKGLSGNIGYLVLQEQNIIIDHKDKVHFNFLLDFDKLCGRNEEKTFFNALNRIIYDILSYNYRNANDLSRLPARLQIYNKKMNAGSLNSFSKIYDALNNLESMPSTPRSSFRLYVDKLKCIPNFLKRKAVSIGIALFIALTIAFVVFQINIRNSVSRENEARLIYDGMTQIGEVYLGSIE